MVHGGGGGGWEWNIWAGVFEAGRVRAVAPDLQASEGGLAATGLDDYVAQVRAALVALPRPRALVGASLGGLLALECAGDADALVLVNPLPPSPWHAQLPRRDWPDAIPWQRDARPTGHGRAPAAPMPGCWSPRGRRGPGMRSGGGATGPTWSPGSATRA